MTRDGVGDLPAELHEVIRSAQPLADRFLAAGHRLYLVGGVVRDHLLGRAREESDLDATTDALPEQIKTLVAPLAEAVWTQGERFGTIGCTIAGQAYEITTHRAETYDDASRKPLVSFGDRIEDDLARRDFTVNAIAVDLGSGLLVDPHGGRDDLAASVLRTPLDPQVAFSDDPLRMLRAARFRAGYGFTPTTELVAALRDLTDRMAIVSAERIRAELQKLLLLEAPGTGVALLASTGLLAEVLPTLGDIDGLVATRLGDRAAAVPPDPAMRWAAFLGPVGVTPAQLRALKFSGAMTRDTVWFGVATDWVERVDSQPHDPPSLRRAAALVPRDRDLTDLFGWVEALRRFDGRPTDDLQVQRQALAELLETEPDIADPAPLLTGEAVCALLAIEPGPEVGAAMRWLRDLRLDEGPVAAEEAASRLLDWWPTRPA